MAQSRKDDAGGDRRGQGGSTLLWLWRMLGRGAAGWGLQKHEDFLDLVEVWYHVGACARPNRRGFGDGRLGSQDGRACLPAHPPPSLSDPVCQRESLLRIRVRILSCSGDQPRYPVTKDDLSIFLLDLWAAARPL